MNRRDALKNASIILGFTISAGTAAAVLKGCKIDNSPDWTGKYLSEEQIQLVDVLSDLIIPKTDTPGAREAQVVRFIDATLACDNEKNRMKFLDGLTQFDARSQEKYNKLFITCTQTEQTSILDYMIESNRGKVTGDFDIFKRVKERVVVGYCKSKEGATQFLKYDSVPGGNFEGCVDYASVGGTWAL